MNNVFRTNIQWSVLIVLLTFTFIASAQNKKLILSNGQETEIQGNATINISSGDITVQPVSNKLIVDEPASQKALVSIKTDTDLSNFSAGQSIDVTWTVAFTKETPSCQASVSSGAAAWTGNKSTGNGTYTQVGVTVSTLPATLELTCNNYNSGTVSDNFTVRAPVGGGGSSNQTAPVITNFYALDKSNGSVDLVWNVSDADSCTGLSNPVVSGWNNTSVNKTSGVANVTYSGSSELRLSCSNSAGNSFKIVNHTAGGGGNPPQGCENVITPPGLTATSFNFTDPKPAGISAASPGINGYGAPFIDLGNYGVVFSWKLTDQYVSIGNIQIPSSDPIYVGGHLQAAKFLFNDGGTAGGTLNRAIISMSDCPGDFKKSQTAACLVEVPKGAKMYVTTDPDGTYATALPNQTCVVEKGKSYYLNFFSGQNIQAVDNASLRECTNPFQGKCAATISAGREL